MQFIYFWKSLQISQKEEQDGIWFRIQILSPVVQNIEAKIFECCSFFRIKGKVPPGLF